MAAAPPHSGRHYAPSALRAIGAAGAAVEADDQRLLARALVVYDALTLRVSGVTVLIRATATSASSN